MKQLEEEWKDIKGYEGRYQVSSIKRLKSIERVIYRDNHNNQTINECILKPFIKKGVYHVKLANNGNQKSFRVEHLYSLAFKGLGIDKGERIYKGKLMTVRSILGDVALKRKSSKLPLGVYFNKQANKYASCIRIKGKSIWLGNFYEIEEAEIMYKKAVQYDYLFKGIPKYFRIMLEEVEI